MAGLLDYYRQNPELWEENKHLLAKDPAYDLGMMDLGAMSFQEKEGGEPLTGLRKYMTQFTNLFTPEKHDISLIEPITSPFGEYSPDTKEINIYDEPFTKDDAPSMWVDEAPKYNVDKARTIAHENRHLLTDKYPELYAAQPTWSTLDPENVYFGLSGKPDETSAHWRQEAFNRFMDYKNFPELRFKTPASRTYPRGMSAGKIEPTDTYFDKIWRDKWEPHAKAYDEKVKEIAERKKSPKKVVPIHSPHGGGPGTISEYRSSRPASERQFTGHGKSGMGRDRSELMATGGIVDAPLPGRSRDI